MRDYTALDGTTGNFYGITVERNRGVFETIFVGGRDHRRDLTRQEAAAILRKWRNDPKRYSLVRW